MKSTPCILLLFLFFALTASAQEAEIHLDRVLLNLPDKRGNGAIAADQGSAGVWERLMKLKTTGSVMHTTAHPDDEHAGLLTYLGRGKGYRTALLTINRGEGGANAIGSELFDALGLIRTEELRKSARYYGLDDQYYTSFTDYGYSKMLEEALRNWGREKVLGDMVRVIRLNRPFVVVSRFHGSERDGHGHHQAAGGITPEAVEAAGDPSRFPEQIQDEGLKPWTPFKYYRGGVREAERWHVQVDPGMHDARLGVSYQNFGYFGLSLQRSQTSGRYRKTSGSTPYYYERLGEGASEVVKEQHLLEGIDTSLSGMFDLFGESVASSSLERMMLIEESIERAMELFDVARTEAVVPALAEGLLLIRELITDLDADAESVFMLKVKALQFEDAIHAALGIQLSALGVPNDTPASSSPWAPLPTMGVVIPGQSYDVKVDVLNPSSEAIEVKDVRLVSNDGLMANEALPEPKLLHNNEPLALKFDVDVALDASLSDTYFSRATINDSQYEIASMDKMHTPAGSPAQMVVLHYEVSGVDLRLTEAVRTRRANLPKGYAFKALKVAPRVAVNASPARRIVPLVKQPVLFNVDIEILNNDPKGTRGTLRLDAPASWQITPASIAVSLDQPGQQEQYSFQVAAQGMDTRAYNVKAVFESNGVLYSEGYETVDQEGLETHYLYKPAQVEVHGLEVDIAEGLNIGYIMGVGDAVPDAISQLGANVSLLSPQDLESGALDPYDTIVVGTRAYAVRQDLLRFNNRLMDYARDGGHVLVLYQTPEYVPAQMAPYPAELPRSAEEISEEDAPVTILEPDHAVFQYPNKITVTDFDHWVEQRGSKFFSSWDDAYLPLIVSQDTNQDPQKGGWLMADLEGGHFTYFAYAIHRQAPFAVPGALRIFANLLSYNKRPGR